MDEKIVEIKKEEEKKQEEFSTSVVINLPVLAVSIAIPKEQ